MKYLIKFFDNFFIYLKNLLKCLLVLLATITLTFLVAMIPISVFEIENHLLIFFIGIILFIFILFILLDVFEDLLL